MLTLDGSDIGTRASHVLNRIAEVPVESYIFRLVVFIIIMASRITRGTVAGVDKALELLRTLPRVSLANLKGNPGANKKVSCIFSNKFWHYP